MKNKLVVAVLLLLVLAFGCWLTLRPEPVKDPYKSLKFEKGKPFKAAFPAQLQSQIPELKVKGDPNLKLNYTSLKIRTYLEDGYARTRYELFVTNPHEKTLEADFELVLNEGQALTAFAMEVNGELRPAVAVEKKQARVAYEATVRKGIDPGLLEHAAGNIFRMRVFPLLNNTPKKIVYEVSGVCAQDASHAYFALPLIGKYDIQNFNFKAISYKKGKPIILKNISFKRRKPNLQVRIKRALPQQTQFHANVIANYTYFSSNIALPLKYARKHAPKSLTVCWDVSASRAQPTERKQDLDLLQAYIQRIPKGRLELICFAHQVIKKEYFDIQNGRVKGLAKILTNMAYDGGSALSCLSFGQMRGQEVLLFSDGLQTLGAFDFKRGSAPIYPVVNSAKADLNLLSNLAEQTSGAVIDLHQLTITSALQQLARRYLRFLGFKESPEGLAYYQQPLDRASQRLLLNVRLPKSCKKLTAQFGLDQQHILATEVFNLKALKVNPNKRTEFKRWALSKLLYLEKSPEKNQKAILALGVKHKLVTSATSLLVLDAVEDYLEYRIIPPPSLQKAYFAALAKEKKQKHADLKTAHLKQLRKDWKAYQIWYWKDPKKRKKQKIEPERRVEQNFSIASPPLEDAAPPPPPSLDESSAQITQETTNGSLANETVQLNLSAIAPGATTYSWTSSSVTSAVDLSSGFGSFHTTVTNFNGNATGSAPQATIAIAPWNPRVPYLKILRSSAQSNVYQRYLQLKDKYAAQPSFFIDVAEFFSARHDNKTALRVLTNLAEMELKDAALLRVVAQKMLELKSPQLALEVLKEVLTLRPEEPQSYRDYALALAQVGNYDKAVRYLWKLVEQPFEGRFSGIHLIALNEINHLLVKHPKEIEAKYIPAYFKANLPVDIRVVLNWDADNTDVDLWITEPNQEKCMYSYKNTTNGGRISNDFTQGYGPEEYLIRKAPKGSYRIQAHYFGNHRPTLSGKAILTVQFFQYYGTPYEVRRVITRRLGEVDEEIDLATFEF
ncbi:MAG: VIT domain-containing protein [Flavobacteriales bacterium]